MKTVTCLSPAFIHTVCLAISGYEPFSATNHRNTEISSHLCYKLVSLWVKDEFTASRAQTPKAGKEEVVVVLEVGELTRKKNEIVNENSVSMQGFVLILLQEPDLLWWLNSNKKCVGMVFYSWNLTQNPLAPPTK